MTDDWFVARGGKPAGPFTAARMARAGLLTAGDMGAAGPRGDPPPPTREAAVIDLSPIASSGPTGAGTPTAARNPDGFSGGPAVGAWGVAGNSGPLLS